DPYWVDLLAEVMFSSKGEELKFVYRTNKDGPEITTEVVPRREENDLRPKIGVLGANSLTLVSRRAFKGREHPVWFNSAAFRATTAFEFGDQIIGCTDPDDPDKAWTPLPDDWRNTEAQRPDYFVFSRRNQLLAGKKITVRVKRDDEELNVVV